MIFLNRWLSLVLFNYILTQHVLLELVYDTRTCYWALSITKYSAIMIATNVTFFGCDSILAETGRTVHSFEAIPLLSYAICRKRCTGKPRLVQLYMYGFCSSSTGTCTAFNKSHALNSSHIILKALIINLRSSNNVYIDQNFHWNVGELLTFVSGHDKIMDCLCTTTCTPIRLVIYSDTQTVR